ncbi:MAG TPA: hypothetical protein PLH94_12895 [Fimbriimonadaceae bacterium]|nr:hypothetical protein [Fimbriimonadaceae bacterium]
MTRAITVLAWLLVALPSWATDVLGIWNGTVELGKQVIPVTNERDRNKLAAIMKMTYTLNLKKDGTYVNLISGEYRKAKPTKNEGTWKQTGLKITLTPVRENGVKIKRPQSLTVDVARDGSSMGLTVPYRNSTAKIKFVRPRK